LSQQPEPDNTQPEDDQRSAVLGQWTGIGIALGAGIGVAIGVAMDNISLGIPIGVGIGLILGLVIGNSRSEPPVRKP